MRSLRGALLSAEHPTPVPTEPHESPERRLHTGQCAEHWRAHSGTQFVTVVLDPTV